MAAYLLLRGMKTLHLRIERQSANAAAVAASNTAAAQQAEAEKQVQAAAAALKNADYYREARRRARDG